MKILIIDGAEANCKRYQSMIADVADCETVVFTNAEDALAWCAQGGEPDLLLINHKLPSMNGLEFLRRVRETKGINDVPAIMFGAADTQAVRREAFALGAIDFISLPADTEELQIRIKHVAARSERFKQESETADWLAAQVKRATAELIERERKIIYRLARIAEYRDPESALHPVRVSQYARLIALTQNLRPNVIESIFAGSPLHDVGNVAIPDHILLKQGKLTTLEFDTMKQHTLVGYELLKDDASSLLNTAATIALTHHERYDGAGYPNGLKGDDIPLAGRICALADSFDVLTSQRPYKPAFDTTKALAEIMSCRGTQFDPLLVDAFKSVLPEVLRIKEQFADAHVVSKMRNTIAALGVAPSA
ncbi:MAG: response regulator [Candidatus Eremiobacteraeota bacterium]|nr:response regulator [Candidatus Eremiobacteraeota bacterium]